MILVLCILCILTCCSFNLTESDHLTVGKFDRITSCLGSTFTYTHTSSSYRAQHYQNLLHGTEKYRHAPVQTNGNTNRESFIEKLFIDSFAHKNVQYFGGIIPIFVQWTDYQQLHKNQSLKNDEHVMFRDILPLLMLDLLYLAVAQANKGLSLFRGVKNVLVLSAGGVGHVPIPLVNGTIAYSPFNLSQLASYSPLAFYGSLSHGPRRALISELQREVELSPGRVNRITVAKSSDWQQAMANTVFNLAPVGFGRGTFRLSEIVRSGRIPVILHQDYPWLPYEGTPFSPQHIGLVAKKGEMKQLVVDMNAIYSNTTLLREYLTRVQQARPYYTNQGLLRQIELFFRDPFGPKGGYLRCSAVYKEYKAMRESNPLYRIVDYVQNVVL